MKLPVKTLALAAAALVVLLVTIAWMAGFFTAKIEPGKEPLSRQQHPDGVAVEAITHTVVEPVPASVAAKQATRISSRLMARITAIHVRSGETVKEGQLLAELDPSALQSRANQLQEQVRSIAARLTEAEQNLERMRELHEDGLVAQAELDRAEANAQSLSADLAAAEQGLDEAQTAVSYTKIRSPIDGRVIDRFAEPGDTAIPGNTLLSLYNPLSLQVEAHVREQLALTLELNQAVEITIPSLEKTLPATIEEIVPAADPGSRSFQVKARFEFDNRLRPGMYARLLLPSEQVEQLVIPNDRVAQVGQLDVVWVDNNGVVERRFVKTGTAVEPDKVVVTSGLDAGEIILPVPE